MYILCLCLLLEYDIRLKILFRKRKKSQKFTFMKHKITRTKIKRIHFYETLYVKKNPQYYAIIRIGGFVLPMQKSEGVLSEGVLSEGVLSEGVLS